MRYYNVQTHESSNKEDGPYGKWDVENRLKRIRNTYTEFTTKEESIKYFDETIFLFVQTYYSSPICTKLYHIYQSFTTNESGTMSEDF